MKFCFLLQRRFAFVGHKMAVILQKKYGIKNFCGYVEKRGGFEFLKTQRDVKYSSLLLDEDIFDGWRKEKLDLDYLKNIEQEYGIPNFWTFITVDRVIMHNLHVREYPYNKLKYSHEEIMTIFQAYARAVIGFLEREKADLIFMTVIGSIGSKLLYHVAKKKKIKVIVGYSTRLGDGYTLTDSYNCFSEANILYDKLISGQARSDKLNTAKEYLNKFRRENQTYLYHLAEL